MSILQIVLNIILVAAAIDYAARILNKKSGYHILLRNAILSTCLIINFSLIEFSANYTERAFGLVMLIVSVILTNLAIFRLYVIADHKNDEISRLKSENNEIKKESYKDRATLEIDYKFDKSALLDENAKLQEKIDSLKRSQSAKRIVDLEQENSALRNRIDDLKFDLEAKDKAWEDLKRKTLKNFDHPA